MDLDPARERRIDYEIVVDAYDELEVALGWRTYLEDHLTFPLDAIYQADSSTDGVEVTVQAFDQHDEDTLEVDSLEFYVEIVDSDGDELWVLLEHIHPIHPDENTLESVLDWHYWKARQS